MKPKSYRAFSGNRCSNCKYVVCIKEWDSEDEFYCTLNDKKDRPISGSCFMNENFCYDDESFSKQSDAWEAWAEQRKVCAFGCCDEYKEGQNVV